MDSKKKSPGKLNDMLRFGFILAMICFGFILSALRPDPFLPADVLREYKKWNGPIDYNQHVRPILSDKCFACHGPDKAKLKAGLRLDQAASAYAPLPESPGKFAIRPGRIDRSELMHRILSNDPEYKMPVPESHLELSAQEKAVLARWIEQGAAYKPHWAFVKPQRAALPEWEGMDPSLSPVDRFIQYKLRKVGLSPSAEAGRELLLRRLSFDLTGLPPTMEEADAFLADTSSIAYERQVDRLLSSPHFGERMAAEWLDVARFADSHGYTVDRVRDMSPYRDWVIAAYNKNMPYDRFVHEQLAGDLMPSPNQSMRIATAFNRNHPQNTEGGIVEEEFQAEYVIDRTNTFGEAFMAMSLGCARCHDHKYDPVSQKDYYSLFAFFNNVLEAGQIAFNDDLPTPTLPLPNEVQQQAISFLQAEIDSMEQSEDSVKAAAMQRAIPWLRAEAYRKLSEEQLPMHGMKAWFPLDGDLRDRVDTARVGVMKHDAGVAGDSAVYLRDKGRRVLSLDGDVYLDLKNAGVFRKSQPFTVGLRVWIPTDLKEGVIIHKSIAERLYNYKGFHIALKDGHFELLMAHTAPSNAIIAHSLAPAPRERWVQLTLAYDGSSRASGLKLYADGKELAMRVLKDHLWKDIVFFNNNEPGLQVGGWWRGLGFRGGKAADIIVYDRLLTVHEMSVLAGVRRWSDLASKPFDLLTEADKLALASFQATTADTSYLQFARHLKKLRTTLADTMQRLRQVMVMEEMPVPKPSYVLQRGRYDMPGERVTPGTPNAILGFSSHYSRNRYGLAQWLTAADHPLTARVAVNRIWQQFFGTGLVKTSEDFGNQGEMPSHPELLDWLAVDFRESGWNVKRLVKMVVMSKAYRQDSRVSPGLAVADPDNRMLARGPSGRLTAEMLRDNALMASGLLNPEIGGPSVKPYQPAGLWDINGGSYKADSSRQMHRRSLYILIRRTVPNPTLTIFDAMDRSVCISRRQRTNTPLQALVTLNDPTYVEAAKALGNIMSRCGDVQTAIRQAYRRLTGRQPHAAELQLLMELHTRQRQRFQEESKRARGWLGSGITAADKRIPEDLIAAHTVVASTILNSDAALMKR